MRILGFGTYDSTRHPRIGIVFDGLRAHGDEVVEANSPLGFTTAERVEMLQRPWLTYRLALRLVQSWRTIARTARHAAAEGDVDAVIVGYMGHLDVLVAKLLLRRHFIVLDLLIFAGDTARDRGETCAAKLRMLDLLDRLAVAAADLVLVDTDEDVELIPPRHRDKAFVVPVGASEAWFDAHSGLDDVRDPASPMRIVFFGLFTPLQGAEYIGNALSRLVDDREVEVTMVGQGQDAPSARMAASDNRHVTWLDWVEPDQLPSLVATHDVCLGIFGTTPKAMRVVPNKVFQGGAAGCAIVTSDTPPQRRLLGDNAVFVPAGDPDSLAGTLRDLSADRDLVQSMRSAAQRLMADRFRASRIVVPLREQLLTRRSARAEAPSIRIGSTRR